MIVLMQPNVIEGKAKKIMTYIFTAVSHGRRTCSVFTFYNVTTSVNIREQH